MPTETELTQLKIYHASTNAIAEAAISGGQVDPNSIIVTDEIDPAVTSIGNAIGDISLGNGLTITNNILSVSNISWGNIIGTLSSQTDLQNALDDKLNVTPTFIATTFNPGTAITFSQEDLADMYENQYDIIRVTTEILPNVFFNLSFRKSVDTEASGLTSVKYDYTTCANNNQLEEICFQILKSNDTYSTTSYHLQLANPPVTDVQTSDGTSIVSNTIATLPSIYAHHIYIVGGNQNKTNVYCTLITNFSTSFDLPSFIAYINNMDSTGTVSATGTVIYNRVGTVEYCRTVAALIPGDPANNTIGIVYHDTGDAGVVKTYTAKQGTGNLDLTSLTDAIVKIM